MLSNALRIRLARYLSLSTLQVLNEYERRWWPAAAEDRYLCSAAFCRLYLVARYHLSAEELREVYDPLLAQPYLLPLDAVTKIASLTGVTAYDQHLYLDASVGLLHALRARNLALCYYYLVRGALRKSLSKNLLEYLALRQGTVFAVLYNREGELCNFSQAFLRALFPSLAAELFAVRQHLTDNEAHFLQYRAFFNVEPNLVQSAPVQLPALVWPFACIPRDLVLRIPTMLSKLTTLPPFPGKVEYLCTLRVLANLDLTAQQVYLTQDSKLQNTLLNYAEAVGNVAAQQLLRTMLGAAAVSTAVLASEIYYGVPPTLNVALLAGRGTALGLRYFSRLEAVLTSTQTTGYLALSNEVMQELRSRARQPEVLTIVLETPEEAARLLGYFRRGIVYPASLPIYFLLQELFPGLEVDARQLKRVRQAHETRETLLRTLTP